MARRKLDKQAQGHEHMLSPPPSRTRASRWPNRCGAWLACGLSWLFFGCQPSPQPSDSSVETQAAKVNVVVIGDEALSLQLPRRWEAEGLGTLSVETFSEDQLAERKFGLPAAADVVIYPANLIGEFLAVEEIMAVPLDLLDPALLNREGFLSHYRNLFLSGTSMVAIPLGGSQLAWVTSTANPVEPPETWGEFSDRFRAVPGVSATEGQSIEPWVEPLADLWAAHSFLSRAAPAIRTSGTISTLFNVDTLEPLLTTPPFVQTLQEMVDANPRAGREIPWQTPAECWEWVVAGRARAGLAAPHQLEATSDSAAVHVRPLPGRRETFDFSKNKWSPVSAGGLNRVPYLILDGHFASVANNTPQAREAIRLWMWLVSNGTQMKLGRDSKNWGPVRVSHLGSLGTWFPKVLPNSLNEYAETLRAGHQEKLVLAFPRLAAQREYQQALADAVRQAVMKELSPAAALEQAAARWREITARVGSERQQELWRKSEGY